MLKCNSTVFLLSSHAINNLDPGIIGVAKARQNLFIDLLFLMCQCRKENLQHFTATCFAVVIVWHSCDSWLFKSVLATMTKTSLSITENTGEIYVSAHLLVCLTVGYSYTMIPLPFELSAFHPGLAPAPTTWHREQQNQWHLGTPSRATVVDSTWSRSDRPEPGAVWLTGWGWQLGWWREGSHRVFVT